MRKFSGFIDAAWHRMLNNSAQYQEFCQTHAGGPIQHVADPVPQGKVGWATAYEETFGALPNIWFTDADGAVDQEALARYQHTGIVITNWDCHPARPDEDDTGPAGPQQPLPDPPEPDGFPGVPSSGGSHG